MDLYNPINLPAGLERGIKTRINKWMAAAPLTEKRGVSITTPYYKGVAIHGQLRGLSISASRVKMGSVRVELIEDPLKQNNPGIIFRITRRTVNNGSKVLEKRPVKWTSNKDIYVILDNFLDRLDGFDDSLYSDARPKPAIVNPSSFADGHICINADNGETEILHGIKKVSVGGMVTIDINGTKMLVSDEIARPSAKPSYLLDCCGAYGERFKIVVDGDGYFRTRSTIVNNIEERIIVTDDQEPLTSLDKRAIDATIRHYIEAVRSSVS